MIRRGNGLRAKIEAKKDVVKSITISGKKLVTATIFILVALLSFWAGSAVGNADSEPEIQQASVKKEERKKIDQQYALSHKYHKKAHYWLHKRRVRHKYHRPLSPKSNSLSYETKRASKWRKIANNERKKYLKLIKNRKSDTQRCKSAGFPGRLCPDIIKGAALEGKKAWAFDSNLAWIVRHESGFRPCVLNGGVIDCNYRGNRAFGLFQFLGSTWSGVGCRQTSDAVQQTRCGIRYISRRYHSPAGAVGFWQKNRWY